MAESDAATSETLGPYRVLSLIGKGGMGEVFLAEDPRLHRQVALKRLHPCCTADDTVRLRLLREARVASALNHPNIAVIYDIGDDYVAMEYVPGETLGEYASRNRPTLRELVGLAVQIADALGAAHARGIVHRDLKPGNLVVGEGGRVKVLDFGLAQWVPPADENAATWSGDGELARAALVGTLAYMSPEQARGEPVDGRSDVHALGVVLYELAAGRRPYEGRNSVELLEKVLREPPPPLAGASELATAGLERLVFRMLAKRPEDRPADMAEVRRDLESLLLDPSGLSLSPDSAPGVPTVAVMGFANITRRSEDDWLGTGIAETVASDLEGALGLSVVARERVQEVLRALSRGAAEGDESLAVPLGRALGARFVISGGFQRQGDAVRVTARVTEVGTGAAVHSVKLDGAVASIFELQDRIVAGLSDGLRLRLTPGGGDDTRVVEAYEAYSKGVANLRAETRESLDRAVLFLERAVALDPGYARAHLKLGAAFDVRATYLVLPELHERALAHFRKAIELRPTLGEGWRELGLTLVELGRVDEGLDAIRRGIALDPMDASAHAALGRAHFIGLADFAAAVPHYEKALTLNPQAGWYALQLAHCAALLHDFERAERAAWKAVALQEELLSGRPGVQIVGAYMRLGQVEALQERFGEALERFAQEREFLDRFDHALKGRTLIELDFRTGSALLRLGDPGAQEHLRRAVESFQTRVSLGSDDPFTRYYHGCALALLGRDDDAVAALVAAARLRRRYTLARVRIEPDLQRLGDHPAFRELVQQPLSG
jgi:TolB-like protein/Flp pilus assembly protein TadD/predicted Ser/Thr protein kinase